MRNKRKKVWVDRFQTYLMVRIGLYCFLYQIAVWAVLVILDRTHRGVSTMFGPEAALYSSVLGLAMLVLLGLLFVYDALRFAHKFVGPLYRFRKTIEAVTENEEVDLIRLRQGDMLQELKDELNQMLQALAERGAVTVKKPESAPAPKETVSAS